MKTLLLILIFPVLVAAQSANTFRQVTFANLGAPNDNNVRYVSDGAVDPSTGACTSGGFGAYAFRVQTGASTFVWRCTIFPPGGSSSNDVTSEASTSLVGQAVIFADTTGKRIGRFTQTGWMKAVNGVPGTQASINLATDISGNIPIANIAGGTNAGPTTVLFGDNTWRTPAGGGTVTNLIANNSVSGLTLTISNPTSTPTINLSGVPSIAGSNVTSGVVPVARLGTGLPSSSNFLRGDGTWAATGAGIGSVTSVALGVPGMFTVSGSPVTTNGTLSFSLVTQSANQILAGPTTGSAAQPVFRSLVAADIPSLDAAKIGTGVINGARLGSGSLLSGFCLNGDSVFRACGSTTPGGSPNQFQFNNTTFGGATNFTYTSATGQVTLNQLGNGNQTLYGKRLTDTAPTGNFILFQNQAASADLFKVDVAGNTTVAGTLTMNTASGIQDILTVGKAIQLTSGTRPTCDSTTRFTFWTVAGGIGVKDTVEVCAKAADNSYAWRVIY